jgi:hypothetical protein
VRGFDEGSDEYDEAVEERANGIKKGQEAIGQYFIWMDYTSLRQCKSGDFDPAAVVELVGEIKTVVALFDQNHSVVKRTFCVLELFAAHLGGVEFIVHCGNLGGTKQLLAKEPINTRNAACRDPDSKAKIDDYIRSELAGGFGELNVTVTEAIMDSLAKTYVTGVDYFGKDGHVRSNLIRDGYEGGFGNAENRSKKERQTVYTTRTGQIYHFDEECGRGDLFSVELWEAEAGNRGPCTRCA